MDTSFPPIPADVDLHYINACFLMEAFPRCSESVKCFNYEGGKHSNPFQVIREHKYTTFLSLSQLKPPHGFRMCLKLHSDQYSGFDQQHFFLIQLIEHHRGSATPAHHLIH